MTPKRFMLVAGEASGDALAAELARALREGVAAQPTYQAVVQPFAADLAPVFFGAGGPRMAAAGVELAFDLTRHAVIGFSDVFRNIAKLKRLLNQLVAVAAEREPHVIICVDYPGFNRRFAAAVKRLVRSRRGPFNNWDPVLVHYISPQVWASRPGRALQMARDYDLVLSIFPFEKAWYAERVPQLRVEFIGHPMIERHGLAAQAAVARAVGPEPVLLLLPGSRRRELDRHIPVMLQALEIIRAGLPGLRAVLVAPNEEMAALARLSVHAASPQSANLVTIQVGGLTEALGQADAAIASTGTVTMECALFGVPAVTLYKTSWAEFQIARRIVTVKSATMPNLLAGREVFPEFIQDAATPANLALAALDLLRNNARREGIRAALAGIVASLGGPGASRRAAAAILEIMRSKAARAEG